MADSTVIRVAENSPEQVAYQLLKDIASVEGFVLYRPSAPGDRDKAATRKWILDTYAECISAVLDHRSLE